MKHEESIIQAAIVRDLSALGVFLFSVPNEAVGGGKNAALRMSRFKAMGLRPGVTDLVILSQGKVFFMEVKDSTGRLSEHQKRFRDWCFDWGYLWAIVRSSEEAINQVRQWGLI